MYKYHKTCLTVDCDSGPRWPMVSYTGMQVQVQCNGIGGCGDSVPRIPA